MGVRRTTKIKEEESMKNLKLATKIGIVVITILTIGLIIVWKSTDVNVSSVDRKSVV